MLGRETKWRQGSVLSKKDAVALQLITDENSDQHVVVVSHDCDLANDKEPHVEVIVGNVVSKGNPMFGNARNPRRLHLLYSSIAGGEFHINLCQVDKAVISAMQLVNMTAEPEAEFFLESNQKAVLKQWLAARYGRPAFPNAFEARLRKKVKAEPLEKIIADILKPASNHLVGLFLDMDSQRGLELLEGDPYSLKILVVYDAIEGGEDARIAAESVAASIVTLFHGIYGAPENADEIALESCVSVADTHLSLANLRKIDQWRVEYISMQADPEQTFLSVAAIPA